MGDRCELAVDFRELRPQFWVGLPAISAALSAD
jgi:hypothetical protein